MASSKQCFKCGEIKELSEFYTHPQMADGHLNKCKECTKRDVRKHRRENPHVREADKQRWRDPERKRAYQAEWGRRNRHKINAHLKVRRAVMRGELQRQPCEQCGAESVEAHHDDYNKPLEVRWLCPLCHRRWHADHPNDAYIDIAS